jgi:signal peptidase I
MSSTTKISPGSTKRAASANVNREETPFEALASICAVLVVGLFILTFLAQNYVIPSGSMENTLLVGDHLVVDQITLIAACFVDAAHQVSRAEARRYRGVPQARLSARY